MTASAKQTDAKAVLRSKLKQAAGEARRRHEVMDAQFEAVVQAAKAGDWSACQDLWAAFERALVDHISYEESHLFPEYAKVDALAADDAKDLKVEHSELLKQVEALSDDLRLLQTPRGTDALIAALRRHAKREDAMFHPWLEATWG